MGIIGCTTAPLTGAVVSNICGIVWLQKVKLGVNSGCKKCSHI